MNFELLGKATLRSKDDQPRQRTALHSSAYYNNNDNNWHQGEYEKNGEKIEKSSEEKSWESMENLSTSGSNTGGCWCSRRSKQEVGRTA